MDATLDVTLRSWIPSANGHADFPVQNLPMGIFAARDGGHRGGMAIGDCIVDLGRLHDLGLLQGDAKTAAAAAAQSTLNSFLALGGGYRRALRVAVSALLCDPAQEERARPAVFAADECSVHLPADIGDYTDFYAGIHHAQAVGKLFRPEAPLLPNYKHVPVAYHGRASTIRVSGQEVHRPRGQFKRPADRDPVYAPTERLDFELELGIWIGLASQIGSPIPVGRADEYIAGYCLLNDWSARDIQTWEYQPLGPFLAKNFLTSISPWIVSPEALQPFKIAQDERPRGDPAPLPHLWDAGDQAGGALDLELRVYLLTDAMRRAGQPPVRITAAHTRDLYWTPAQMVAHHTSGGCDLRSGDLFGSGTISSPGGSGSLLELSGGGSVPLSLPDGEQRTFLSDGDEITFEAHASRQGFATIGFGACRGRVVSG